MNPRRKPFYLFALLLVLFPAIGVLAEAWRDGFAHLAWWQWGLLAALPALAWIWLRYFSLLGCRDACAVERRP